MTLILEARPSDSPFVKEIWRARSEHAGSFVSIAASHWEMVEAALHGHLTAVSVRSGQRRFVQAVGLTPSTIRHIERARDAMALLQHGASILDTVHEAGYDDQPHLTRALTRWLGQTPAQIIGLRRDGSLSFPSKT